MLDQVSQTLGQHQDVVANVVGHTDSTGNPNYNMQPRSAAPGAWRPYLGDRGVAGTA